MLRHRDRIDAAGTAVVVVHDSREQVCSGMLHDLDIPYPVVVDAELRAYRGWGLGEASAARTYLSPRIVFDYARMMLGGERPLRTGGDSMQLGGDFVVGADGRMTYAHPQTGVDDRPPTGLLLRELEAAAAASSAASSQSSGGRRPGLPVGG